MVTRAEGNQTAEAKALGLLQKVFGYPSFRLDQAEIIKTLINGGDALALMPTGGGKSLCYQIPSMLRSGTGVVVSPLKALMQDQVDALRQFGVRAGALNSSVSPEEAKDTGRALARGELDLLYLAPERLLMPSMLSFLERVNIAMFAIDEAHCVSRWGHDFRKEYIELSVLHERFPEVPRIALTATADEVTRKEIIECLNLQDAQIFISGFDRPNIRYRISEEPNPRQALLNFINREHSGESGIIYCMTRKNVDSYAEWFSEHGLNALPYHAGMSEEERIVNQEQFTRNNGMVMVATIAFGMGIDKPDVRFVAHMNLPKNIEAYYQETGRAGRDGLPADAWMTYSLKDIAILRQLVDGSDAEEEFKRIERRKLNFLLGLCEIATCRRKAILSYFGEDVDENNYCGNCDNCLEPPEQWEGTVAVQKALSSIARTGQRFGVQHLIKILMGKEDKRIQQFGHNRLKTWGCGKELSKSEWESVFRQMVARNIVRVNMENYGELIFTESSITILQGEETIRLRRPRKSKQRTRDRRSTTDRSLDQKQSLSTETKDDSPRLRVETPETSSAPSSNPLNKRPMKKTPEPFKPPPAQKDSASTESETIRNQQDKELWNRLSELRNRCFVMLCNNSTEPICLDNSLFAADRWEDVKDIQKEDWGVLYNYDSKSLQGVFRAVSNPFNAEKKGTTNPFRGSPFCYQFEVELYSEKLIKKELPDKFFIQRGIQSDERAKELLSRFAETLKLGTISSQQDRDSASTESETIRNQQDKELWNRLSELRNRCFVMLCNNSTEPICLDNSLFAADRWEDVKDIQKEDWGVLYNYDSKSLQGVFRAVSNPFNAEEKGTTNPFRGSPFCYQFEVELYSEKLIKKELPDKFFIQRGIQSDERAKELLSRFAETLKLGTISSQQDRDSSSTESETIRNQQDKELWNRLSELRKKISHEQGVPPYFIFHDSTLRAMVSERPEDLYQLAHITGVGARKLDIYGERFLQVITEFA